MVLRKNSILSLPSTRNVRPERSANRFSTFWREENRGWFLCACLPGDLCLERTRKSRPEPAGKCGAAFLKSSLKGVAGRVYYDGFAVPFPISEKEAVMFRKSFRCVGCLGILPLLLSTAVVIPAEKGTLRAGAAKLDITPAADAALQMSGYGSHTAGFKGIHDDLNVRAIVLDDGAAQAAIVSCEVIGLSNAFWEKITERVTRETGIARDHLILASVHTHAAPSPGVYGGGQLRPRIISRISRDWKTQFSNLSARQKKGCSPPGSDSEQGRPRST